MPMSCRSLLSRGARPRLGGEGAGASLDATSNRPFRHSPPRFSDGHPFVPALVLALVAVTFAVRDPLLIGSDARLALTSVA